MKEILIIIILFIIVIYLVVCVIFAHLELILLILEPIFGKIAYKTEPRLRYVTEKQFKSKIVRGYAANFLGMYEKDLRKRWK